MAGVLSGINVTAFTHYAAGPLTAQFIGALGANVVKVEAPSGDLNRTAVRDPEGKLGGASPYFLSLNRNQRCIALDLKTEKGREVAWKLVRRSDMVIENYKPGALDRLDFGYEAVKSTMDGSSTVRFQPTTVSAQRVTPRGRIC